MPYIGRMSLNPQIMTDAFDICNRLHLNILQAKGTNEGERENDMSEEVCRYDDLQGLVFG